MFLWRGLSRSEAAQAAWRQKLERRLAGLADAELNYPEAGITSAEEPPEGFRTSMARERIGNGEADLARAVTALRTGRVFTQAGLDLVPDPVELSPGVGFLIALRFGPIAAVAPCRVVMLNVDDEFQATMAYGTLRGHKLRGEEAFILTLEDSGTVWLTIRAHAAPSARWLRPMAILIRQFQQLVATRYITALKHLTKDPAPDE